ncbi:DNA-directed RNA polymerase II core subunit RPB11 [Aspergillus clavatus NRRL 1]|uniref:DNA-directed RNA polymerase II subunit RPB11a, putative n=1 Tax=Aspergillus clavatus (strain ATCC 1007 / CBS 513.65 / DSM 816 / NCTC 3887 / NRRL 1 / QM 1276 / 107) TaxID=344612 RepID=A1CD73_ASPCL|nr:DNA-directed RNA polymerase II subunit RPB11a, putative [Aspergillus clavatus NRRL 1]EAW11800.1 DNA-directed RNA polymerase II subunit RPB11a, putative [Aspergillus clavatus NRRL 1]
MSPKKQFMLPNEMAYARWKHASGGPRTTGQTSINVDSDQPHSFESFVLSPGEEKVEVQTDTRIPSTAIFTFNKEDHTLGNLLRSRLLQSPHVLFAGYKIPHPLVPKFELRIQTDGEVTPKDALLAACHDLVKDLGILSREFTKEFELRKMVGAAQQQQNGATDGA